MNLNEKSKMAKRNKMSDEKSFTLFMWAMYLAIQDIDEFASSSEQIWWNLALHHLLTNGSSALNGCRQNEGPNSW